MSLLWNIILWTLSLVLAIAGIVFGILASWNSSKANKKIEELIASSWISEESQKFFFDNLMDIVAVNKEVVKKLRTGHISYYDYSIAATRSRLHIIPPRTISALIETEFKDIVSNYLLNKRMLDQEFLNDIGGDFSILSSVEEISEEFKEKIIEYHKHVIKISTEIIRNYTSTVGVTQEYKITTKK